MLHVWRFFLKRMIRAFILAKIPKRFKAVSLATEIVGSPTSLSWLMDYADI